MIMNSDCKVCNHHYEKESGYFIGAMIASYFLGVLLLVPTLTLSLFVFQLEMPMVLLIGSIQLLFLQPLLFRFSRLFWIQLEFRLTKSMHKPPQT